MCKVLQIKEVFGVWEEGSVIQLECLSVEIVCVYGVWKPTRLDGHPNMNLCSLYIRT